MHDGRKQTGSEKGSQTDGQAASEAAEEMSEQVGRTGRQREWLQPDRQTDRQRATDGNSRWIDERVMEGSREAARKAAKEQ
mmetsp:Transcript_24937/g.61713  ORF Transcript_24937/g.61713 Transcript_24937/m.61713 type:complete len:81 (+) Transcript_24937:578-820(+)